MHNLKYSVGIDVSKDSFKACFSVINTEQNVTIKSSGSFSNKLDGFKKFLEWVKKHSKEDLPSTFLMEATGVYYEQLAWFLYDKNFKVSVIVPNKAKRYLQSLGLKSKNDKIDAEGLSKMGAQQVLPIWIPLSKNIYTLRSLTRLLEALNQQKTAFGNQLHALNHCMYELKDAKRILTKTIQNLNKQIVNLEKDIHKIIMKDTLLKSKYDKISKIKGVGMLTFSVIVAETNGFELFENQRQLVSYAGYDVVENQSGNRKGKTRISKKGNSHIRRALHMPALITVKNNEPVFKNLYERIYDRTGIKMKAYVAIQKKLLCMIYALWKKDKAFEPDYHIKKIVLTSRTTQDEPLCNQLH